MATTRSTTRRKAPRRKGLRFPGNPTSLPGKLFRWLLMLILAFIGISLLQVLVYKVVPVPVTITMLMDKNGITKDWTPLSDIDPDMPRAAIAGEDAKFCQHHGFDTDAIRQAMQQNARGGRIRGGSTISQQTAKNVFLWQGGGFFRKGLEAWYTVLIEAIWGKRRIMEVYLNVAETGIGTYGVQAGAIRYFNHGADRMSRTEAARIAAVLPLPKKRGAVAPTGFTRRHGNNIARWIGHVKADGLDACLGLN
ncbi:monofunctional biosynthetic peptidoglycan transglycosylase [Sphingobium sp. B7D2B]|uniref:monofunctional biosynthetic peptidoglycan transglycosylase n=1 Tax=Sphingobium sp. B7D2B TaxID=2940583 RepID=UPI0022248C18|nr:monofunctional biosynthetic peptidoglycan transglycosylase [Sphingobium sp. B7D2B]MCW2364959.1 monofunctional biosynthetic peptidoglycan transglycosylase [Sphingobium sp. B7D2B]